MSENLSIDEILIRESTALSDALTERLGKRVGVIRATVTGELGAGEYPNFQITFYCRLFGGVIKEGK